MVIQMFIYDYIYIIITTFTIDSAKPVDQYCRLS